MIFYLAIAGVAGAALLGLHAALRIADELHDRPLDGALMDRNAPLAASIAGAIVGITLLFIICGAGVYFIRRMMRAQDKEHERVLSLLRRD